MIEDLKKYKVEKILIEINDRIIKMPHLNMKEVEIKGDDEIIEEKRTIDKMIK